MAHNATSLTSWAKALKATLDAQAIDSQALFAEAGLDIAALNDPNARYALAGTSKLWQLAVNATGNPALGLEVARYVNQTTFHALGYSLIASSTLKEAFERLVRYFRIVTDAGDLDFRFDGKVYKFAIKPIAGPQPRDEALDAMMAVIIGMCRMLAGRDFRALKVSFMRAAPSNTAGFEKLFKAPLEFMAPETALFFDPDSMRRPVATANPDLARHNDEILARYVADFDKQNLANRVHGVLIKQLPQGEPSQEKIAEALHMSLRNLQRKLKAEGVSYKEILNRSRCDLALSYIASERYSMSEIAYLLGFSDTSSFTRSFRRWTGMTPSEARSKPATTKP